MKTAATTTKRRTAKANNTAMKVGGTEVQMLPVDSITAFPEHPFKLYEGERLADMVESVREHGILIPVIVRKVGDGYQMLSGHNRQKAAQLAELKVIPAVVKEGLSDEEAYVYVVETNMIQRSFAELLPSEKAAVMAEQYDKLCGSLKRAQIIRELEEINGQQTCSVGGHNGHQVKSRDIVAAEYGFSSRNAARYLRLNHLIRPFKDMIDENQIGLLTAVDLSFLGDEEQFLVWNLVQRQGLKLKPKMAAELRKIAGTLTEEKIGEIIGALSVKKEANAGVNLKIPKSICKKYFDGMAPEQMASVVEQALAAWFSKEV